MVPLSKKVRGALARDTFARLLAFHPGTASSRLRAGVNVDEALKHLDLAPRDAARVKLLCRLPGRGISSSYFYSGKFHP